MAAPVVPFIAEELWERLGKSGSIHTQSWPEVDETALEQEEITLVVQVNGKLRDRLTLPADVAEDEARERALASDGVPGRLVNIVAN